MSNEHLIKKYSNRRLYDTRTSQYITLENVRNMILEGTPFKVVDKKTNEDITRNILLQIIMEHESGKGEPMFSVELLMRFIRNYGENTQDSFTRYMEQSLSFFSQQQEILRDQMSEPLKNTPGEMWLNMGEKQMDAWQKMQEQLFQTLTSTPKDKRP